MHWIHQNNLGTDEQREPFRRALARLAETYAGVTWSEVKLVPFEGTVIPELAYPGKVFALGSTSMLLAARRYGWKPGHIFDDHTFRFEAWLKGWGRENLLNGDAWVGRFGDAKIELGQSRFMRPCQDLKTFTGTIISESELVDWQKRLSSGVSSSRDGGLSNATLVLDLNTPVAVAEEKLVMREWRFFVVGGKVITGSQYRTSYGLSISEDVDRDVLWFATRMVNQWQPERCFVLDVCEIREGLRIVEVNCLNNSGCYACDLLKTFAAIENEYRDV